LCRCSYSKMYHLIKSVLKRFRLDNYFSLVSRSVFIVLINPCTNASFTLTNNSHFRFSHYCHDTYTPYRCLLLSSFVGYILYMPQVINPKCFVLLYCLLCVYLYPLHVFVLNVLICVIVMYIVIAYVVHVCIVCTGWLVSVRSMT